MLVADKRRNGSVIRVCCEMAIAVSPADTHHLTLLQQWFFSCDETV